MYEKFLVCFCLSGIILCLVAGLALRLKETCARQNRALLAWLRKESPIVRFLLVALLAKFIVHGSEKQAQPEGDGPTRLMLQQGFDNGFSEAECAVGYALWQAGTNETWNFSNDCNGVEIENWRKRGGVKDRMPFLDGGYPFVQPDGVLDFGDVQIDALGRTLGVVPEANWGALPLLSGQSLVWTARNAFGDILATWRNSLLDRSPTAPVSIQTRVSEDGDVIIKYDLGCVSGGDETFTARIVRDGVAVETNFNAQVTSLRFYSLCPEDYREADPDGDGVSTLEEVKLYHTDPRLADTDGDGLFDGDEILAGSDPNVRSVPDERILSRVLASPTNDVYASAEEIDPGHLYAVKLWDGFAANRTNTDVEVLFERTIFVGEDNGWRECFLSSRPDAAGAWNLEGLVLEWRGGTGVWHSVTRSLSGDSLGLSLPEGTGAVTVRLKATGPFVRASKPMYLLCYAPTVTFGGCVLVEDAGGQGKALVVTDGRASRISLNVDYSGRPSTSLLGDLGLGLPGFALMGSEPGDLLAYGEDTSGPWLEARKTGVCRMPEAVLQPLSGGASAGSGAASATNDLWAVVLDPSISYGGQHAYSPTTLTYDRGTDLYGIANAYPVMGAWEWRNWMSDASGRLLCTCSPEVRTGTGDYWLLSAEASVTNDVATGIVKVYGTEVWRGTARHAWDSATLGRNGTAGSADLSGLDACAERARSCADGKCDEGDGTSLNSVKFRTALGYPRAGQISGYLYFETDVPVQVGVDQFSLKAREDAAITVFTNGTARTYSCPDPRGRDVVLEPIPCGVRLTVRAHADGCLEHVWEIVNEGGAANLIRVRRISRLGNIMNDETFSCVGGVWSVVDNVSGLVEQLERTDGLNDPDDGCLQEIRTKYDAQGRQLDQTTVVSSRIGDGDNAVLRETYWERDTGRSLHWRAADYWDDPAHGGRHGRVRMTWGNCTDWRYHDYDSDGFESLLMTQRNGSGLPSTLPHVGVDGLVSGLEGVADAYLTVYSCEPFGNDSRHRDDVGKVRLEVGYVVRDGVPTPVSRTWTAYVRQTVSGYAAIRRDVWRAADADAVRTDPRNAHSYEIMFSETDDGVPFGFRGRCVESLDENGVLAAHTLSLVEGRVVDTIRKSYSGNAFPTYEVKEYDATRNTLLRSATCLAADDRVLDECVSRYDEKDRLRSSVYSDGTSLTNAYSCCRLLWSRDRAGRSVLRSALTGQDRQYYAEEETWLGDLCTTGAYRVVQHFIDCLGRETNRVVSISSEPGSAASCGTYTGEMLNSSSVSYPAGGDDCRIAVSPRGMRTVLTVDQNSSSEVSSETVYDADGHEVVRTETTVYRGGRTVRTTLSGNCSRVETSMADYDDDGRLVERKIVDSSLSGFCTNVVVRYDFLGRIVSRETPDAVVSYSYRGAGGVVVAETAVAGDVVRTRTALFNACGEQTGWLQDGVSDCRETGYECGVDGEVWRVVRDFSVSAGGTTNGLEVARTLLTGRGGGILSRRIVERAEGPTREIRREGGTVPGFEREIVIDGMAGAATNEYFCGVRTAVAADGVNRMFGYDACGSLAVERKRLSDSDDWIPVVGFSYDGCGDLAERTIYTNETSGAVTRYAYDALGRVVSETDPYGGIVTRLYDGFGNVVSEAGAITSVRRAYDDEGRVLSLATTRDGVIWDSTGWVYDVGTGRQRSKTYADGSSEQVDYTDDGLPRRTVKPSGAWRECAYDDARRVCAVTSNDGSLDAVFGYDAFGRLSSASSSVVRISRTLSDGGIATNETMSVAGREVSWARATDAGRIVGFGEPGGQWLAAAYDGYGRISSMTSGEAVVTFSYDAFGHATGYDVTLTNGLVVSHAEVRDAYRGLPVDVTNSVAGVVVDAFACRYDAEGRLVGRNGETYGFGPRGELLSYTRPGADGVETVTYAYDAAGNLLTQSVGGEATSANALNQQVGLSYSADGGLLELDGLAFAYDAAGRIVSVSSNGVTQATYAYDPFGRRVLKTAGGSVTRYYYDGWRLVREIESTVPGQESVTEYFWAAGERRYELLYVKRDGAVYVPLKDQHLNVIAYVDAEGTVVARYAYDPFGRQTDESGPMATALKIRYTSHYADVESGLVYYGMRYYAPSQGRWMSRDPLGERADVNLYRFCLNDPVSFLDILGMLTYQEAVDHYWNGPDDPKDPDKRLPKRISFDDIDTSEVSVIDFPQVSNALARCRIGTTDIRWRDKDDNHAHSTYGAQKMYLGDVSLKLEGRLVIKAGGDWTFTGTMKCFDDLYDFNRSTHRSLAGEILTALGRNTDGKVFWIEIRGAKNVSESGNCCELRERWRRKQ